MDILQTAILGIVSVCLILSIKNHKPEIAILLSIIAGVTILMLTIPKIKEVLEGINKISQMANINEEVIGILLKVVGIVYITEFASGICKDAKEESIAQKVQIAGKVIILGIAIPMMTDILNLISGILV